MRHRWPSRRGSESARIDLRCPTSLVRGGSASSGERTPAPPTFSMRVNHRRRRRNGREQILHGSNVVTAGSKAVANEWRRVRGGGLRDACLFYGTFEGALKGLVIHVMATHDTAPWIGRMRVLRKNPEPRPGMPGARILPLKGVGKRNAAGPSAWSFSHHARARDSCSRRLGAKLPGNIKADPWSPCPRTMIVP